MRHSFTRLALSLAVGVALIGSAMSVHAAGLTTDQVSAIISMLKSFGVEQTTITQVNQVLGGSSASSGSSSASSISCVDITRTLTIDSQGSDVTSLQAYLIAKGYLASGNATGFYGTQTAQAVGKLQVALGIISASDSGLGILGPKTRAAIACTPQTITETPAPLQTQSLAAPATTVVGGPVINSFTATPVTLPTGGGTVQFSWSASNVRLCNVRYLSGNKYLQIALHAEYPTGNSSDGVNSGNVSVSDTTTFQLICSPVAGSPTGNDAAKSLVVTVGGGAPSQTSDGIPTINQFTISPQSVPKWSSATLSWSIVNIGRCTVVRMTGDNPNIDMSAVTFNTNSGIYSVSTGKLGQSGTYQLNCVASSGSGAMVSKSVGVTVTDPVATPTPTPIPTPTPTPTPTPIPTPTVPNPAITSLTATPATVIGGNISTLAWSASNAASCTISPISGDMRAVSYTGATSATTPAITQSTTYQLTCTPLVGATGGAATRTVTVNYQAPTPTPTPTPTPVPTQTTGPAPTITAFYASPVTVDPGNLSVLTWIAKNTSGCTVKATTASGSRFLDTASAFASPYSGVTYLTVNNIQQATTFELSCAPMAGSNASSAVATTKVSMF